MSRLDEVEWVERLTDLCDEFRKREERLNAEVERLRGWIDRSERQEARARRAEAEVARLTAERDALAVRVARVEALAEEWRYKGEFGWGPWQIGEGPDPEGYVMDHCASALRAALASSEADTSDTQPANQEDQS